MSNSTGDDGRGTELLTHAANELNGSTTRNLNGNEYTVQIDDHQAFPPLPPPPLPFKVNTLSTNSKHGDYLTMKRSEQHETNLIAK